jgi:hypothetical protein
MNDLSFDESRLKTIMDMPIKELHELVEWNVSLIKRGDLSGGDMSPLVELRRVAEVMLLFHGTNVNTQHPSTGY